MILHRLLDLKYEYKQKTKAGCSGYHRVLALNTVLTSLICPDLPNETNTRSHEFAWAI